MQAKVVKGNLLDQDVEVIVNPWNRNIIPWWLLLPQGVSGSIKKHAGYEPFKELGKKGEPNEGNAAEIQYHKINDTLRIDAFWQFYRYKRNITRLFILWITQ